jgi:transcriptional regulator with XRE-family HTH domain
VSNNNIGAAVAHEMARRALTDSAAADLLGVSQTTITRWRNGGVAPKREHAVRIAAFTGLALGKVERMIDEASPRPAPTPIPRGKETVGVLIRKLERDRGITPLEAWQSYGIDKSRYYRLRSDKATPHLADIPELARRLKVKDERLVLAAYRTELARTKRDVGELRREEPAPAGR